MFGLVFDSVGAGEWVVLLAVILVVMGPKRLPSALRTFGQYYAKFRRAAESFKRQILEMDTAIQREVSKAEQEVDAAVRAAENEVAEATKPVEAPAADATAVSGTAASATTPDATADVTGASGDGNQAS